MKIKTKIRKDKKNNQHTLLSEIFYRETSSKNKNKNNKEKKIPFLYVVGMFSMPFPPPPGMLVFVGKAFIPPDREEKLGECHGSYIDVIQVSAYEGGWG